MRETIFKSCFSWKIFIAVTPDLKAEREGVTEVEWDLKAETNDNYCSVGDSLFYS